MGSTVAQPLSWKMRSVKCSSTLYLAFIQSTVYNSVAAEETGSVFCANFMYKHEPITDDLLISVMDNKQLKCTEDIRK